jgi:hypothetical protein
LAMLRSSATAGGDRQHSFSQHRDWSPAGCDPRPPWSAAASQLQFAVTKIPAELRSSATMVGRPQGRRCRSARWRHPSCDPRPPCSAAAVGIWLPVAKVGPVAILGRCCRRPPPPYAFRTICRLCQLRSSAACDGRHTARANAVVR